jgi:signal transduction histidine kinase
VHPVAREGLLYAAARDVTARREAEEKVRQTELTLRASRDQLRLLADEHAAIRRVATLVAHAVAPSELFSAVAREVRALLESDAALLLGCEDDDTLRIVAADAREDIAIAPGVRYPIAHDRLAARIRKRRLMTAEPQSAVSRGQPGAHLRDQGLQAAAAAPVIVDGALWGVVEVAWSRSHTVPASTAERLTHFAELVATAVANAHSRAELTASRARVVAAADEARRRIERDLHDGTQQRLVALSLALRLAEAQVPHEFVDLRERISAVAEGLAVAVTDLQEFSRGIHPAILSRGGLGPALRALARRSSIPVDLEANIGGRMDTAVEVAAYYLVSEALTNAAKHSGAARIEVHAHADGGELALTIRDDGVGGADLSHGSGLVGLLDRVQAVGGTLNIRSEHGRGTTLRAAFPLERHGDGDSAHRAAPAERLGA